MSNGPTNILERPATDSVDPNNVRMGALLGMVRKYISQAFHDMMTESSDTVEHINDSLGSAHNANEVVSAQVEVCISQEMMASHDNPHVPSIESS